MSSNSYILSGDEQIALIDPGALDDQLDCLVGRIASMLDEYPRPVVVYLTHAHLDHCFQLNRLKEIKSLGDLAVAAQEIGAKALEGQNGELTLAGLLGKKMAPISVDIELLSKEDELLGGGLQIKKNAAKFSYFMNSFKIRYGPVLHSQTVLMGKGDLLEIYSTPGHSPDSICLRAGNLLFTGDLFFAPNAGMAGAYGWSRSHLIKSIYKVMWILENRDIHYCCSGHGRVIDVDMAWTTLRSMYQDVLSLSCLEEINPGWAKNTAVYAEDLMRELERLFAIIIGRLTYISHILEELEERQESENLQNLIDIRQIDDLFFDFNRFAKELHKGRKLHWDLVHKAGQIIRKLNQIFESKDLGTILDKILLERANRMLNDYSIAYRGFRPTYYADDVDINDLLRQIVDLLFSQSYQDEKIIEAIDHDDFIQALRSRIGHINIFDKISLKLATVEEVPLVRMDKERFIDALIDLLERLPSAGANEIIVSSSIDHDWISIGIFAYGNIRDYPLDEKAWRFFERAFALSGGLIQNDKTIAGSIMQIEFLPRESFSLTS